MVFLFISMHTYQRNNSYLAFAITMQINEDTAYEHTHVHVHLLSAMDKSISVIQYNRSLMIFVVAVHNVIVWRIYFKTHANDGRKDICGRMELCSVILNHIHVFVIYCSCLVVFSSHLSPSQLGSVG